MSQTQLINILDNESQEEFDLANYLNIDVDDNELDFLETFSLVPVRF
ncbi:MAG TPA: hypothetical protein VKR58_15375 [Aquella sp.]|nr:hypothetical protein [Aquella sp.]